MPIWIRVLKSTAYATAIGSVTITPLLGFVVGDKRPSAAATALQMLIAVLMLTGVLVAMHIRAHRTPRGPRLAPHPFGDVCPHGVQFLNQCDECPDGWQPRTSTATQPSPGGPS